MRWTIVFFFLVSSFSYTNSQVYVNSIAAGANDGTSWNDAYTDLVTAINNSIAGDEIWVAAGTYYPGAAQGDEFRLRNNRTIYGGFPNIGNPLFGDRDYIANVTILSGDINGGGLDAGNTYHVVYNNGGGINATAILDGFTIEGGYADTENDGGGIYFRNCSPTVRNCIIQNNYANDEGGGVYLRDCASNFINCTITNNTANDDAGGVYIMNNAPTFTGGSITNNSSTDDYAGAYINNGTASFISVSISNNNAGDEAGGICINNGSASFNTCTFDANTSADDGAGVIIRNNAIPSFIDCNVTNNTITAGNFNGGGFYIIGSANPTLTNCTITGNTARRYGGGIYIASNAFTNAITGLTISNNTVSGGNGYGGGIFLDNSSPNITNNIITNNTATTVTNVNSRGRGGGIYLNGNDVSPLISGNTITGNTASTSGTGTGCGYGGGIYCNQSVPNIDNNIISNNTANTSSTGASCGDGGGLYFYLSRLAIVNNNQITSNNAQRYGGGIYMYRSDPVVTSNTIDGNIATAYMNNTGYGGGICVYDDTGAGTSPSFSSNIITNNQANDGAFATSGYGAGVYIRTGVDPIFTSNTISGNTCSQRGGGVYVRDGGTIPVFHRNNINSNTAADGGGVYIQGNIPPEFYNNLIYNNNATNGGGFYFNGTDLGTYLNNTITGNTATNGGGLYCTNNADFGFSNNILWDNGAANNIYINDGASDPFFYYCVVEGGIANFQGGGAGGYNAGANYNPFSNVELDPQFINAPGNDYNLTKPTSPCIGAGNPATVTGDFPADEDYDGSTRVRGVVDIGAFETNNAPQFVTLPYPPLTDNAGPENVIMDEDAAPTVFALNLSAVDIDDENITWSISTPATNGIASIPGPASTGPPWAVTKAISYVPNADYNGVDMFVVRVSDGTLTDEITVNVTINSINDLPSFVTTPATLSIKSGQVWTYNIATTDPDHALNTLTLTCLAKPAAMVFSLGSNGTGTLTWTPTDGDVSPPDHTVTLQVSDPAADFVQQTFDITVLTRFIYVPADYPTIQQGINAAATGDKVIVADGTYVENINFNGQEVEVEGNPTNPGNVIIDGNATGPSVVFENGEAGITTLNGFTIRNGIGRLGLPVTFSPYAPVSGMYGGGIFCYQSSPLLKNLIVENNSVAKNNNHGGSGAGIYIGRNSNVTIEGPNTIIQNNTTSVYRGGGICIDNSTVTIDGTGANGVDILNNEGGNYGGGIAVFLSTLNLVDVNINNNDADGSNGDGGGVFRLGSTVNYNPADVDISSNTSTRGINNDIN